MKNNTTKILSFLFSLFFSLKLFSSDIFNIETNHPSPSVLFENLHDEIIKKKEGFSIIALPWLTYSSDFGLGIFTGGNITYNGKKMIKGKTNNLFYRFPYEFQLGIQFYLTTLGQHRHTINIDVPRFLNDRWHLWAEVAYFAVLDNNYFGQGADAVYDRSLPNQAASNPQYSRQVYYKYSFKNPVLKWRNDFRISKNFLIIAGLQLGYIFINSRNGTKLANIFQTVDGKTRIDFDAYLLSDLTYFDLFPPIRAEGGWDNSLELGVAWDSRDYEPYPTEGLYTELNLRYNAPFFNLYSYVLLNWKIQIYLPLYFLHPLKKAKVISAHRANFDWSFGDVPFYKMPRLGGNFDLRGYVDSRFFDYYSVYFNHEIRWRIAEHKLKRTRIYHTLVLFFDHGVVYNQEFNRQVQAENRWKISSGLEYLLTVDQNTHINLTLGASPETEIEHLNFTFGLRLMF